MCSKLEKWHTKEYVINIIAPCSHYIIVTNTEGNSPLEITMTNTDYTLQMLTDHLQSGFLKYIKLSLSDSIVKL